MLIVLDCSAAWSRGVLRGFSRIAHEQGWSLFHYRRVPSIELLASEVAPAAVVVGPGVLMPWPRQLQDCVKVAVNGDRCAEGIASVGLDGAKAAELAVAHLQARGFRHLTTFRFDHWGAQRERHFREVAARLGAQLEPGWWSDVAVPSSREDRPAAIMQWLSNLPKPCGIFALCDEWARCLARYARAAQLRIPEDVALLGVDNDLFECEVESPALSSVAVPWYSMGESAARLVQQGLRGARDEAQSVLTPPLEVVVRRSSDVLAIEDPLVAAAVRWIHGNFSSRMTVPAVARAVRSARQRLERRFRQSLGRTVLEEVRRTRVEGARRLLSTTQLPLADVARRSGFTTAALLSVAFRREVGISPGAYRKRARGLPLVADD